MTKWHGGKGSTQRKVVLDKFSYGYDLIWNKKQTMNKQSVYEQLKIDEGVKYEVYLDHLGYKTFGIGHLVTRRDPEWSYKVGTEVSEERVRQAFENDIQVSISECMTLYGQEDFCSFPDEVQQILVNMMFNLGRPRLKGFRKFNAAIKEGRWAEAAVEGRDSLWYKQVTNRAERLMTRLENLNKFAERV